jgi:hypothetical protein
MHTARSPARIKLSAGTLSYPSGREQIAAEATPDPSSVGFAEVDSIDGSGVMVGVGRGCLRLGVRARRMKAIRAIAIVFAIGAIGFSLLILGTAIFFGYSTYIGDKLSNQDFEFFGQIITESGEPIEGVSFVAEWRAYRENFILWNFEGAVAVNSMKVESDSGGRFAITGVRGVNLRIFDFSHPRYEIANEKKHWGFTTGTAQPRTEGMSYDAPFIVKMARTPSETRP